jgi:hypothetical protein
MDVMERDTDAPLAVVVFNGPHFDERCAAKNAHTEIARAELVGTDRRTLHRWRRGECVPDTVNALVMAERLETTVERLLRLRWSHR